MIHRVKYGWIKVVMEDSLTTERPPDLTFVGSSKRTFAAFFAPFGSIEGEAMRENSYNYYTPFEEEFSDDEAEELLREEKANDAA